MTTRRTRPIASAVLTLAALATALPAAHAVPGTTTVRVGSLDRGQDPDVAQVLGTAILDGDRRVEVDTDQLYLVGESGDGYVVIAYSDGEQGNVERVDADGTRTVLVEGAEDSFLVSQEGEQLFQTRTTSRNRSVVVVRSAETGDRQARRVFRNVVTVLDADEDRAVLGFHDPSRTLWWHTGTDETKRISERPGYAADISSDRYAVMVGNPLDGGCSVVAALSAPRTVLWRSCDHAVLEFSPNGRRLVTHGIYLDGPVSQVQVRGDHGRLLHTYRASGIFGSWDWESNRSLLLLAHGREKTAVVRCDVGDCERASRTIRTAF